MPHPIDLTQIRLTGGYLFEKENLMRKVTLPALFRSYQQTGRVDALKLNWRRGEPNEPHIFWDSDIAKWIEGAAYALLARRDPELEDTIDALIDDIGAGQTAEGYFNTHYLTMDRSARFTRRGDHELYCAGHLMEAAVAYFRATAKRKLLDVLCRYADHIEAVFAGGERPADFRTPGHEEIELALVKLYQATGEKRYLELAKRFLDQRGHSDAEKQTFLWYGPAYAQDHLPVREQRTAEGHAVRALYLYCAMADIARLYGDAEMQTACEALFSDITGKKMYVTGGLGGNYHGESFSYAYDLPNELAYAETCASIAFVLFAQRMYLLTGEAKYIDALELMLYNAIPAGLSVSGDRFFYTNPLEVHPERRDRGGGQYAPEYERPTDFSCSCCPPNIIRLFASAREYMIHTEQGRVYINLYGSSVFEREGVRIEQSTDYPWDGAVRIDVRAKKPTSLELCLRIPAWCGSFRVKLNGGELSASAEAGYLRITRTWGAGDTVELVLDMPVAELYAHPAAHYCAGRVAVKRGPVVYCAEEADNGGYLKSAVIRREAGYCVSFEKDLLGGAAVIDCAASVPRPGSDELYRTSPPPYEDKTLRLIPYASWANRGRGEMSVWLLKEGASR